MIENTLIREILILSVASSFVGFALWALIAPHNLADKLWYTIKNATGWSEFSAIYVWVFIFHVALAVYAFLNSAQALYGNILWILLLAQPLGRIFALFRFWMPNTFMICIALLEILWGGLILLVQPS